MRFSLSIDHAPWLEGRRLNLANMLLDLLPLSSGVPYFQHDTDYRGKPWVDVKHDWALAKWKWHIAQGADYAVMLSDDVAVMPRFWRALESMVAACPGVPIGLMSNHPEGPSLYEGGYHWYRCNAWLVGPGIVMPQVLLRMFVQWYEHWYFNLPRGRDVEGYQDWYHDDSSINEWITKVWHGVSAHPLPSPIEHQLYIGRSHDPAPFPDNAAEWISWKRIWHGNPRRDLFSELPRGVAEKMCEPSWWQTEAPNLEVA